jgi:hypothetical protein
MKAQRFRRTHGESQVPVPGTRANVKADICLTQAEPNSATGILAKSEGVGQCAAQRTIGPEHSARNYAHLKAVQRNPSLRRSSAYSTPSLFIRAVMSPGTQGSEYN